MNKDVNVPNNSEIDKALKEFEEKYNQEQATKGIITPQSSSNNQREVEGVKFETEKWGAIKYYKETVTPGMIKLVKKISGGTIKEDRQAEYILLGFVIIALAISLYLFFGKSITLQRPIQPSMEELNNFLNHN